MLTLEVRIGPTSEGGRLDIAIKKERKNKDNKYLR
jgi:hypothetical protein